MQYTAPSAGAACGKPARGPPGTGRLLHAEASVAAGTAIAGDSGARLLRTMSHYAAPVLAAGWIVAAVPPYA